MTSKYCTKCKELKPFSEFCKDKNRIYGLNHYCKECQRQASKKYLKTKNGLICKIYHNQKLCSYRRGHELPKYTLAELREWALSQPIFHELYNKWKTSRYDNGLIPSFDRTDDYKGYSLDRLVIMTWKENKEKGHADRRNGINNKMSKGVMQFTREGLLVDEYYSLRQAARATGISFGNLGTCCRGGLGTAGGFVWCYI